MCGFVPGASAFLITETPILGFTVGSKKDAVCFWTYSCKESESVRKCIPVSILQGGSLQTSVISHTASLCSPQVVKWSLINLRHTTTRLKITECMKIGLNTTKCYTHIGGQFRKVTGELSFYTAWWVKLAFSQLDLSLIYTRSLLPKVGNSKKKCVLSRSVRTEAGVGQPGGREIFSVYSSFTVTSCWDLEQITHPCSSI